MPATSFDAHMMAIALGLAERGLGQTAPNPSVGAVIANPATGELIARAVTARGGRPHAETQAIARAGGHAHGATIYVTLEPCSHHGRTGPCSDAIIAAGLKRVVVAIEDPDPRVAGRGLDRLRAAGIEVVRGVGADSARWLTRGHIVRITERRPLVTLKLALDADGEVPRGHDGTPRFVTSAAARAHGHVLRARHDAIMVGAGTVRDDNPDLTCRLPGLEARSPVRVVLSRQAELAPDRRLATTAERVPVWLFADAGRLDAIAHLPHAVRHFAVPTVDGHLWLPAVMETLVAEGITRLLVEGGPTLWRAFANAALADEVVLYVARAGHTDADQTRARAALDVHLGPHAWTLVETRTLDTDTLWRFRRAHLTLPR